MSTDTSRLRRKMFVWQLPLIGNNCNWHYANSKRGRTRLTWGKRDVTWLTRGICGWTRYSEVNMQRVYEGKRNRTGIVGHTIILTWYIFLGRLVGLTWKPHPPIGLQRKWTCLYLLGRVKLISWDWSSEKGSFCGCLNVKNVEFTKAGICHNWASVLPAEVWGDSWRFSGEFRG